MAKKKGKSPPSRQRYEKENPVISIRVTKEINEIINEAKGKLNMSVADVIKVGAEKVKLKIDSEAEIREKAYEEGQINGYTVAESNYKITYPCRVCRKPIEVMDKTTKDAIRKYLWENRWRHAECVDKPQSPPGSLESMVENLFDDKGLLRS